MATDSENDEEVLIDWKELWMKVADVISPNGGCYTINALVEKVDAGGAFATRLSNEAKGNLIRRALELADAYKLGDRQSLPTHVSVLRHSGTLTQAPPANVQRYKNSVVWIDRSDSSGSPKED